MKKIKEAKYFAVMMDCTPDLSKEEQLSIVIRIVDIGYKIEFMEPTIKGYFIQFLNVELTTGLNLMNVLLEKLNDTGIDL